MGILYAVDIVEIVKDAATNRLDRRVFCSARKSVKTGNPVGKCSSYNKAVREDWYLSNSLRGDSGLAGKYVILDKASY